MIKNSEEFRINWQIKTFQVRVIKGDEQLGVMSVDAARKIAQDENLDLVEIVPTAKPPVCRIMDYGKFKYEQQVKQKAIAKKRRETEIQLKEIRLRPGIGSHDADVKTNQAKKFLEDGMKVLFVLQFKGQRELSHKEEGFKVIQKVLDSLKSLCVVEKSPRCDGNRISVCLSPLK